MNLVYRVQHTLGRDEPLHRLLDFLPLAVEVVTDHEGHDPNPLRNYLRCLANPPPRATHMCVMQDDVLPCTDFDTRLREAINEKPDQMLSLFVGDLRGAGTKAYRAAQMKGERWCLIPRPTRIIHVVGLVWPVEAAAAFLDWYETSGDKMPVRKPHRSDDPGGRLLVAHREAVPATVGDRAVPGRASRRLPPGVPHETAGHGCWAEGYRVRRIVAANGSFCKGTRPATASTALLDASVRRPALDR